MINKKVVLNYLEYLEKAVSNLESLQVDSAQVFVSNAERYGAVKNFLYEAIQSVLAIGEHIIAALQLEKPRGYKDIIYILGKEDIIPKEFAQEITDMGAFRVILAHHYISIDPERLYDLHLKTKDFRKFIRYINKFLKKIDIA